MVSPAVAQKLIASVPVGVNPWGIAINPLTHKVYVANQCASGECFNHNFLTVIDEQTLATTSVPIGDGNLQFPMPIAVNKTTNKIYVAASGDVPGVVTVIDGATLATASVQVENMPSSLAVNEVTNKIYVADACGTGGCGGNVGTLTIIDGVTLATTTITLQYNYYSLFSTVAVNPVTNKIYVTSVCGSDPGCLSGGIVTVIDGATLATSNVAVGKFPNAMAVNTTTNKIYVTNSLTYQKSLAVIDGNTLATTFVPLPFDPGSLALNQVTNKIFISANPNYYQGELAVVDGVTLATFFYTLDGNSGPLAVNSVTNKVYAPSSLRGTLASFDAGNQSLLNIGVGGGPSEAAVDETNNRIYVENLCGNTPGYCFGADPGTVSVIDATPPTAWQFVPLTPCRVVDTRNPDGPLGGPVIAAGTSRDFPLPQGDCNIPAAATAYALNVTVVPHGPLGYLTIWPTGQSRPVASTMNSLDGRIKANAAIVAGGTSEAVSVYASSTTDVILDVNGYFVPAPNPVALAFYPLPPCRVADSRKPDGPLGGPYLQGNQQRDFPVTQAAACNIPNTALAYSLNFTVIPKPALGFLSVWPKGLPQPLVSTLNDLTGTIVANAAIVPAGTGGDITTFVTNDTDLVIDINGYFAPAGPGGQSLYAPTVCRVLDTRHGGGPFSGTFVAGVVSAACSAPSTAGAFVLNGTVLPSGGLSYLTLWPDGEQQPTVSTLNAPDGAISSNMAIVPNLNGSVDAFASEYTHLVLDISGYFAP
jgi:DNA-binding beta-propeller fold protein YncE